MPFMKKNAYQIEHLRAELAAKGETAKLKKLYTNNQPEISDLNTQKFWNNILTSRSSIADQDGMTRDRAYYTARIVPQTVKKLLDIGVGHGWVEELLEQRDIEIHGIDISNETIRQTKERFPKWKKNFKVKSLYKLDYRPSMFDAVLLLEVLEHIPPSKTFVILNMIKKFITPGGYMIVSVPTNEGLEYMQDNPSGHVRMYTVPLLKAELELAGFSVLSIKTFYAFKSHYKLKKFVAKWIMPKRWQPNNIIILAQKNNS